MGIGYLIKAVRKEIMFQDLAKKDRIINYGIYHELKKIKKCEKCKKKTKSKPLEVHHIIPKSKGGSNDRKNLMAICHECHKKIHESEE